MRTDDASTQRDDLPLEDWPALLADPRWDAERSRDAWWKDGHFVHEDRDHPVDLVPHRPASPAPPPTHPATGPPAPRRPAASPATTQTAPTRVGPPEQAPWSPSTPATAPHRTGRLFFSILFWFCLATSLEFWWLNTPAESITTPGDAWLAVGRITGLVGGFVLLLQILVMSRVGWLERWVGAHSLLIWHRELGAYLLFAILGHVAATIVGYALATETPVVSQAWSLMTADQDMITASAGTLVLVALGLLAIRAVRRRMSYETWYYIHLTSYLVVVLGYAHQFSAGREFMSGGFPAAFWRSLYIFVLACLIWGRVLGPAALNLRHRLKVVDVVPENRDMISIYIGGRDLQRMRARAGQYFRWRFLARGLWWQAHPFSLSAAPNGDWLRLTVKIVGDHTADLRNLRRGVRVFAEGPSGVFTADRSVTRKALLIAGGSGVAPIRALLEDLPRGTVMIYRAGSDAEVVFRREFEWLARERGAFIWYVLGGRDEPGPRHLFTPEGLRELVPDVSRRDVFLCGPPGLVAASRQTLQRLRVRRSQSHLDPFEF